jgi:hypothetical protein
MPLPPRKAIQLADKLKSLKDATLSRWLAESEKGGAFQIHHSQMVMVNEAMNALAEVLGGRAGKATESTSQSVERGLLLAFQVWEFYRSKLAQRLEAHIQPFLRVCDELAWKCYEPLRMAAGSGPRTKEPPLVFLDSEWSPFVLKRDVEFEGAVPEAIRKEFGLSGACERTPFAVIGLPWCQMNHLPDALLVCHEVGHVVEQDFDLGKLLDAVIDKAVPDSNRQDRWKGWRQEIFADTFGCLAAGPSLVWVLADSLIASRALVFAPTKERYPSDHLRVLYNAALLRLLEFGTEADEIESWWKGMYPGPHSLKKYEDDMAPIAKGFLQLQPAIFGGKALQEIIRFRTLQQEEAEESAGKVLGIEALAITDIRVGFAAARIAFQQDAATFAATAGEMASPQQHLLGHLVSYTCKNDLRGRGNAEEDEVRMKRVRRNALSILRRFLKEGD